MSHKHGFKRETTPEYHEQVKREYREALERCKADPSPHNWRLLHEAGKEMERIDHTARPVRRAGPGPGTF